MRPALRLIPRCTWPLARSYANCYASLELLHLPHSAVRHLQGPANDTPCDGQLSHPTYVDSRRRRVGNSENESLTVSISTAIS
jgi:hypothetical protein